MIRFLQNEIPASEAIASAVFPSHSTETDAMTADFTLSRGDIVMRGEQVFVVWVHGQGEIIAFRHRDGITDCAEQMASVAR